MLCQLCGEVHPPTDEDIVQFAEDIDHARRSVALGWLQKHGREMTEDEMAIVFADDDRELARMKAELGSVSKAEVEKTVEFAATLHDKGESVSDAETRFREQTREFARSMNAKPVDPKPPEMDGSRGLANYLQANGFTRRPEPHPTAGLTDRSIARVRAALGDAFEGRMSALLEGLRGYESFLMLGFDRIAAEETARSRAVLVAVLAGRPIVEEEVTRAAASEVLTLWWSIPGASLVKLTGRVSYVSTEWQREAKGLDREIEGTTSSFTWGRSPLDRFAADLDRHAGAREAALDHALDGLKAIVALSDRLAARLAPLVELGGGPAALAVACREARQAQGGYPGDDHQYDQLREERDAAVAEVARFARTDGEPEGAMEMAARERCEALQARVKERRIELDRAARDRVREMVDGLVVGDPEAYEAVAALAASSPAAFAPGFPRAIADAGRLASFDVGPASWMPCL